MSDFRIGQHDEAIRGLVADMTEVRADIRTLLEYAAEQRGERKIRGALYVGLASVIGAVFPGALHIVGKWLKVTA